MRKQFQKSYTGTCQPKSDTTKVTIPDMGLTIKQLLDNHSRGLPMGAAQLKAEYFDTEIPQITDLTDIVKHKKALKAKEKELKQQLQDQKDQKDWENQLISGTEDLKKPEKSEE